MSRTLEEWAGALRVTAALIFTDIVGSTALANLLGDEKMNEVRRAHFTQARRLIERHGGYEIKTIGDSFMVVFRTAMDALNFALSLHENAGDEQVKIRAGIHVGPICIVGDDITGKIANFTARIVSWPKDDWIVLSDNAKEHIEDELGAPPADISFFPYIADDLKGFLGTHKIWHAQYQIELSAREISQESLTTYLHNKFPDRPHTGADGVSVLAKQLREAGYTTLGDIERAIKKGWSAFLAWEPRRYVGNDIVVRPSNQDLRLPDVGAIRSLFYIVDENFRNMSGARFSQSQLDRLAEARDLLKS